MTTLNEGKSIANSKEIEEYFYCPHCKWAGKAQRKECKVVYKDGKVRYAIKCSNCQIFLVNLLERSRRYKKLKQLEK